MTEKHTEQVRALLGTERPKVADLLATAVQMNPPLEDEEFEALKASIARARGRLDTMPVIISGLGNLIEGIHRVTIVRDQHGRKTLTADEILIDPKIRTAEQEAMASITIQNSRRASTGAVKAFQVRRLVDRTGWSYGKVAEALGKHRSQVSRWLAEYPEPGWNPPAVRLGKDDRQTYAERDAMAPVEDPATNVPKRPPRPKAHPHPWDLRAGEALKLVETLTSRLLGAWAPDRKTLTAEEWDVAEVRLIDLEIVLSQLTIAMGVEPAEPTDEEMDDE